MDLRNYVPLCRSGHYLEIAFFSNGGPGAIRLDEDLDFLLCDLALMNSKVFGYLVNLQVGLAAEGRKNYDVGVIQRTAIPNFNMQTIKLLSEKSKQILVAAAR